MAQKQQVPQKSCPRAPLVLHACSYLLTKRARCQRACVLLSVVSFCCEAVGCACSFIFVLSVGAVHGLLTPSCRSYSLCLLCE